ncbi:MAG: tetratricopeptide repeat protein [Treponema sp.]
MKRPLCYVSIPEAYTLTAKIPGFDLSIPLPLLLPENEQNFNTDVISEEMILAGMLMVFAYEKENQHLDYYREIFKKLRPDIRAEMTSAAILKIKNGDFDLAEDILFALEGLFPDDMRIKLNTVLLLDERARFYEQIGSQGDAAYYTEKALTAYEELLACKEPLPDTFFNAAFFFIGQKNYQKAKSLFEVYLAHETETSETASVRKAKAEELIHWISTQALDDELFKTAYDLTQSGEEEKALEHIRMFLEHHPKVWNAWFLLGWTLRKQGRWLDAYSAFMHCFELTKQDHEALLSAYCDICNELAICLMELERFDESSHWLISALQQEPENIKIISNMGILALKQNQTEDAKGFFKTVLELNPQDYLAHTILQQLESSQGSQL